MDKPFAITLEVGSSLVNRTGSWRTDRPVYLDLMPPCNDACPAGENIQAWLYAAEDGGYEKAWRQLVVDNHRRHHLSFRGERQLADAMKALHAPLRGAELAFRHQEGRLRGVSVDFPAACGRLPQVRIAGQAAAAQHHDLLAVQRSRLEQRPVDLEAPDGVVA